MVPISPLANNARNPASSTAAKVTVDYPTLKIPFEEGIFSYNGSYFCLYFKPEDITKAEFCQGEGIRGPEVIIIVEF